MKPFALLALVGLVSALAEVHVSTDGESDLDQLRSGVSIANSLVAVMAEEFSNGDCCNQTPCFIGCPVGGKPLVSFSNPK
jgi:hypothetical protein